MDFLILTLNQYKYQIQNFKRKIRFYRRFIHAADKYGFLKDLCERSIVFFHITQGHLCLYVTDVSVKLDVSKINICAPGSDL